MSGIARMSVGHQIALACQLECSVPKVGNVHRGADFDDATLYDFLVSGQILGSTIDSNPSSSIGQLVRQAVGKCVQVTGTNTNLGIVLLLVPLAKASNLVEANEKLCPQHLKLVLSALQSSDSELVFEAIRMARPGGMGQTNEADINGPAPSSLLDAMKLAEHRDLIARQWCSNFHEVFDFVVPCLKDALVRWENLAHAIVQTHIATIAQFGDSLIARKSGLNASQTAQFLAKKTLEQLANGRERYWDAVSEFDFWLRSDGRRRNPGSTADLMAAAIFVALVNDEIEMLFHPSDK